MQIDKDSTLVVEKVPGCMARTANGTFLTESTGLTQRLHRCKGSSADEWTRTESHQCPPAWKMQTYRDQGAYNNSSRGPLVLYPFFRPFIVSTYIRGSHLATMKAVTPVKGPCNAG